MNIDINQDSIMNESFEMTVFNVKNLFKGNLGDVVNVDEMKLFLHQGFLEMVIPLRSQVMAEDMTEKLDKLMKLNVLYAAKSYDNKLYKVLAYSTPVENNMFIVFLESLQYGIVDSITIHIFDSIEAMLLKVQNYKKLVTADKSMKVLESQSYKNMLRIFME